MDYSIVALRFQFPKKRRKGINKIFTLSSLFLLVINKGMEYFLYLKYILFCFFIKLLNHIFFDLLQTTELFLREEEDEAFSLSTILFSFEKRGMASFFNSFKFKMKIIENNDKNPLAKLL